VACCAPTQEHEPGAGEQEPDGRPEEHQGVGAGAGQALTGDGGDLRRALELDAQHLRGPLAGRDRGHRGLGCGCGGRFGKPVEADRVDQGHPVVRDRCHGRHGCRSGRGRERRKVRLPDLGGLGCLGRPGLRGRIDLTGRACWGLAAGHVAVTRAGALLLVVRVVGVRRRWPLDLGAGRLRGGGLSHLYVAVEGARAGVVVPGEGTPVIGQRHVQLGEDRPVAVLAEVDVGEHPVRPVDLPRAQPVDDPLGERFSAQAEVRLVQLHTLVERDADAEHLTAFDIVDVEGRLPHHRAAASLADGDRTSVVEVGGGRGGGEHGRWQESHPDAES
jgi:hypothetical protein